MRELLHRMNEFASYNVCDVLHSEWTYGRCRHPTARHIRAWQQRDNEFYSLPRLCLILILCSLKSSAHFEGSSRFFSPFVLHRQRFSVVRVSWKSRIRTLNTHTRVCYRFSDRNFNEQNNLSKHHCELWSDFVSSRKLLVVPQFSIDRLLEEPTAEIVAKQLKLANKYINLTKRWGKPKTLHIPMKLSSEFQAKSLKPWHDEREG